MSQARVTTPGTCAYTACAGAKYKVARARQILGTTQLLGMGATNRAAVLQTDEAGMDGTTQVSIASKVNVHGGFLGVDQVQLVITQHAVMAVQAFAKRDVAWRGQTHHLNAFALGQLKDSAVGRFTGGIGEQHHTTWQRGILRSSTEEGVDRQEIVNQPRSDEQWAQQSTQILGVSGVGRVSAATQILVVHRRQRGTVGRTLDNTGGAGTGRRQRHRCGHGVVPAKLLTDSNTLGLRRHHTGKTPHRDAAPTLLASGGKAPVVHRVAENSVSDIVGGQRTALDVQLHLASGQRCNRDIDHAGLLQSNLRKRKAGVSIP